MKRLTGSLNGLPETLDPAAVVSSAEWHTLLNLGVNLVTHDSTGRLVAEAAESWRVSPDFTEFEFHLRRDIKDSEGRPLDSSDWRASFLHLLRSGGSTHSLIADFLDASGIETPSPDTLRLKLKKPYQTLLQRLTTPEFILVPKRAISAQGKVDLRISSGPYRIEVFDPRAKKCVLRANPYDPRYSPEQADEVALEPVESSNRRMFDKLARGEWNFSIGTILPTDPDFNSIRKMIAEKQVLSHPLAPSSIGLLILRPDSIRLRSKAARLALARLIFNQAKTRMAGPASSPAFQLYPPGFVGALPPDELQSVVNQILSDPESDPSRLPKKLIGYEAALSTTYGLSGWVKDTFEKAGISVETHAATAKSYIPNRDTIDHDYLAFTTGLNSKDPAGSLLYLISGKDGIISDPSHELARLLEKAVQSGPEARAEALHEISRKLILDGKIIPIIHYGTTILSSPGIDARPPTAYDDELQLRTIRWRK